MTAVREQLNDSLDSKRDVRRPDDVQAANRPKTNPVLRSRKGLPSGRAVVGALLICLSVLGVILALQMGEDATFRNVVVARQDLPPGTVLEADHLAHIRIRLDESASFVVQDPSEVIGQVLLGPVARLEFLQASNVAQAAGASSDGGLAVVSLAVDPTRTPQTLAAGELVSVLATFGNADPAATQLVADRVVVLSYDQGGSDFGSADAVLRLGISDGATVSAIINASHTSEISIIGLNSAPQVELPESLS